MDYVHLDIFADFIMEMAKSSQTWLGNMAEIQFGEDSAILNQFREVLKGEEGGGR